MNNGWANDVTRSDVIVVWGVGRAMTPALREAPSDDAFGVGITRWETWHKSLTDSYREKAWIVAVPHTAVSPYELTTDPAVAGYTIWETGC